MKALVYDSQLTLDCTHPEPIMSPGEALIRVTLSGICNTDIEITRGYMGFQGVLGHEFVGTVEAAEDSTWIGTRVVGEINCACGECPTCRRGNESHCPNRTTLGIDRRNGSLAELCTLPIRNLHRVPQGVSNEQAAFVEPLAAALEITDRLHIRPTDRVIVIGDGKLGLLVAQVLRLTGCGLLVVGHHADKLAILDKVRIETILEKQLAAGAQADVVVDCTGRASGFELARQLVRPRGRLVLKSTFAGDNTISLTSLVVDEVNLIGSRCGPFAPALRLLEQHLVDVTSMIEAVYPIDEGMVAFERAKAKGALKVLVEVG